MGLSKSRQQKQTQNRVAEDGHQDSDQTHELKPVPRGHFLAASAHGLFGQEIQSTAIAIQSRSPVGRGFELTRCQCIGAWREKTTGPMSSFSVGVLYCTKVSRESCIAAHVIGAAAPGGYPSPFQTVTVESSGKNRAQNSLIINETMRAGPRLCGLLPPDPPAVSANRPSFFAASRSGRCGPQRRRRYF